MKKLTKKQKAEYPTYIVQLDFCAGSNYDGYFAKALEETDIFAAMARLEKMIEIKGRELYIVDIYAKTEQDSEYGEPLYRPSIRTRIEYEYINGACTNDDKRILPTKWILTKNDNPETAISLYVWFQNSSDRWGQLENYDKQ